MSFLRIGLAALQMAVADTAARLMDWLPIPIQELEPCIPSRRAGESRRRHGSQRLRCHRDCDQQLITRHSWLSHESQG
jgi:hypothetical protein